jgi:hypothetical protein
MSRTTTSAHALTRFGHTDRYATCLALVAAHGGYLLRHLVAQPIFGMLGDPDSRHRRQHELTALRRRLLALDFVLARPAW